MSADPDADTDIDTDGGTETGLRSEGDTDIGTADTMRERSNESRIKLWAVLDANRLLVTGLLGFAFFVGFVAIGELFVPALESTLRSDNTINLLFSTMSARSSPGRRSSSRSLSSSFRRKTARSAINANA